MQNRPTIWNGIPVPYDASVTELGRRIQEPAPARWAAFVALAHTPGVSALELLRESAHSSDPHVRRVAVEAIGVHSDGARLREVVRALISDDEPIVARSACEAAARQRLTEARQSILGLLDSKDDATRSAALRALRELWDDADFDRVFQCLRADRSVEVRNEAAWTLRTNVSSSTWRRLFDVWQSDPLPRHREWACELAIDYGGRELLAIVGTLTNDVDGHVRLRAEHAIRALTGRDLPRR